MKIASDTLEEVTRTILDRMLGLPIGTSPEAEQALQNAERFVAGCVHFIGEREFAIRLDCSQQLAQLVTALLLCVGQEEPSPEEILDAIGEVTNVVGGSIKNHLQGSYRLTVPTVSEGRGATPSGCAMPFPVQISFLCGGEPLRISVGERTPGPCP